MTQPQSADRPAAQLRAAPGRHATGRPAARWPPVPIAGPAIPRTVWLMVSAGLAMLGLLVALAQVLQGAVEQGEARRRAVVAHDDAAARCNRLSDRPAGRRCLLLLDTAEPPPRP